MRIEAFNRGFIKAAMSNGVNPLDAVNLLKHAESSWAGRYFAEKGIPSSAMMDHPYRSLAGAMPGNVVLLAPLQEMGMAATFGGKKNREELYRKSMEGTEERGLGGNMHHFGKKLAPVYAGLGALIGGVGGYFGRPHAKSIPGAIGEAAIGAGVGGLAGGGLGYLAGGLAGGLTHPMIHGTSDESKERALKMKAEHPYLTSLPFGDMIGAAVA
jgi:hypothetical protein